MSALAGGARPFDAPAPAELVVEIHPDVRVRDRGRTVVGGFPFRVLRLTEAGARAMDDWAVQAPVGETMARRALARRLLDCGMLSPCPTPSSSTTGVTFVVPVHDRPVELTRCLDSIVSACPGAPIVVVDDDSNDPTAVEAICNARGATVVRHRAQRGPAAARNSGLVACTTPYVAFVDSDVVVPAGSLERLLAHFVDPCVGAVAPRVQGLRTGRGLVEGYERRHSALDMGASGGLVAPGHPTSYVPSTVLLVRRSAAGSGFDESLHVGEDVDLVWRLTAAGWRVHYEPRAQVWHDHRDRWHAFASRRWSYAQSVGALARRHPGALPAAWLSPWMVMPLALAVAGRPRLAVGGTAIQTLLLGRRLRGLTGRPYRLAGELVTRGQLTTALGLAHAVRRAWSPLLLIFAIRRRGARRLVLAAFATPLVQDALATREPRAAFADVPIRLLDEAIAVAGLWKGCVRHRTAEPLLASWSRARRGQSRSAAPAERRAER